MDFSRFAKYYDDLAPIQDNIDFMRKYNISLNPQKMCGKDISYLDLNGIVIKGSFDDVYIEGAKFRGSIDAIIDPQKVFNRNCRKTDFADVIIVGSFVNCNIEKSSFHDAFLITEDRWSYFDDKNLNHLAEVKFITRTQYEEFASSDMLPNVISVEMLSDKDIRNLIKDNIVKKKQLVKPVKR